METYCGIEFEIGMSSKEGRRVFPYLPCRGHQRSEVIFFSDNRSRIPFQERLPTEGQLQALQHFLDHEQSICENVLETVCRYVSEIRDVDEWHQNMCEDIPDHPTVEEIGEFLSFQTLYLSPESDSVPSLMGLSFSCEWEHEHGFGVALADGVVIDIGDAEVSFDSAGILIPPGVLTDEQQAKSEAIFGVSASESYQEDFRARKKKRQEEKAEREYWNRGFPSVDALTQKIEQSEPLGVRVILDVPQQAAQRRGSNDSSGVGGKGLLKKLMLPENSHPPNLPSGPKGILEMIYLILLGFPVEMATRSENKDLLALNRGQKKFLSRILSMFRGFEPKPGMPPENGDYLEVELLLPLKNVDSESDSVDQSGLEFAVWNNAGDPQKNILKGGPWPGILMEVARKWPGAVPRGESLKVMDGSEEVSNIQFGSAFLMALCEVLEVDAEKAILDFEDSQRRH